MRLPPPLWRMGDWIVWLLETFFKMGHEDAFYYYSDHFRGNKEIFFAAAVLLIFTVLLVRIFRWVTGYFSEVNQGIEALLADDEEQIQLSPEMLPFERKLNTVKRTLAERKAETALAEQQKFFDDKVAKYRNEGHSKSEAEELAKQWVAVPGYSEHQVGLAVDINGATYDLYFWLQENSYKYGFIFRYPGNKTEITGVAEEVWHYRYVGVEAATEMYEKGLCLEEYLAKRHGEE